jgi:hypothetical protein
MLNNIIKMLIEFFKYVKNLASDFFKFLLLIKKIILDEIFFDSKVREPFRELVKGLFYYIKSKIFVSLTSYYKTPFIIKFKFINILFEYFLKYFLTFLFILWILFESLFFRFYLIDTPFDTKMFQDRKEFRKSRFIPIIGFEALSFYNRPFWRIFNNIMVFLSNLGAIFWLIYYVYILDLIFFIKYILNLVFEICVFIFSFISYLFFKLKLALDRVFFVYLLFFWRIWYVLKGVFSFFNYMFVVPFYIFFNLIDFVLNGISKIYLFYFICNYEDLKRIFLNLKFDLKYLNRNNNYNVSDKYSFFFNKVFDYCYFLERFILYFHRRLILIDLTNYNYFLYENFFKRFTSKYTFISYVLRVILYIYLLLCYTLLFLFLLIIFHSYFYLPFII